LLSFVGTDVGHPGGGHEAHRPRQRLDAERRVGRAQMSINGRFWVSTCRPRLRASAYEYPGPGNSPSTIGDSGSRARWASRVITVIEIRQLCCGRRPKNQRPSTDCSRSKLDEEG